MKYVCRSYFMPKQIRVGREIILFCSNILQKKIASRSEKVPIFRYFTKRKLMFRVGL